jgi:hypothetical protein
MDEFRILHIVCHCGLDFLVGYDKYNELYLECGNHNCLLYGKKYEPPTVVLEPFLEPMGEDKE